MRTRFGHAALLAVAGIFALAVTVAPVAAADNLPGNGASQQSCTQLGRTQVKCESPGNDQLYDAPPQVDFYPYAGGAT